jgi:HD-GYP domain-containing protein (c-di-GMP phosphodiesterase class II)
VLSEGTSLDLPDSVDARRYLPYAVLATLFVVVLPALTVLPLAPLEGLADLLVSAVLAIGLSVAAGSVGAALWTRLPESKDVVFGDLMLWRWLRRVRAERQLAETADRLGSGDPLLPALHRLSTEVEARDSFMQGHSRRVAQHAERVARQMGLAESEIDRIKSAAAVHDVGKVFVPHSILAQPGTLTEGEFEVIKRHAADGAELVSELGDPEMTAMVRHHHERVDGTGYPDGLTRDQIPLGARIIAVCDTFDALTSARPYRRAASHKSALDVLCEVSGTQLDSEVVSSFLDYCSGKRSIAGVALVATAPQRLVGWLTATPAGIGASAGPIAQGACVAVAGVCLAGSPTLTSAPADGASASKRTAQAAVLSTARDVERTFDERTPGEGGGRSAPGQGDGPGQGGSAPPRSDPPAPGGGDAPTQQRGGQGPSSGSSPSTSQPSVPRSPVGGAPEVEVPELPAPAPVSPTDVLDPVVDQVQQVLPQVPVDDLTEPVDGLLGGRGLVPTP